MGNWEASSQVELLKRSHKYARKRKKNCEWSAQYKGDYGSRVDRQAQFVCVSNTRRELPHIFNLEASTSSPVLLKRGSVC